MLHNLRYNKKSLKIEEMKKLFLKQAVTPALTGKGGQVPKCSGPTKVTQQESRDASGQKVHFMSKVTRTVKRHKHSQNSYLKGRVTRDKNLKFCLTQDFKILFDPTQELFLFSRTESKWL